MKWNIIVLFLILTSPAWAQKKVTFKVEDLVPPGKLLPVSASSKLYQSMIASDAGLSAYEVKQLTKPFEYNIVSQSKDPDSLIMFGQHPFFNGMYQAYADHRPFVLSPDMILLLLDQGFARHVKFNAEALRKHFVSQSGKLSLVIVNNKIKLDNPSSPWEEVFEGFEKEISKHTSKELAKTLTADFTTTTPVTRIATQTALMESVKPYFQFVQITISCGIPEITLEGSPRDWERVLEKAQIMKKYELSWWIDELEPLLKEFIKASKGKADKDFWRNMFKYHTLKVYGSPKSIDGWIVKFYPYSNDGQRNGLKELRSSNTLPSEILKVDMLHSEVKGGSVVNTPLELWSGFVGLDQDEKTFALKPRMGWMVRKKDNRLSQTMVEKFKEGATEPFEGIYIRVDTIPPELFTLSKIDKLTIDFINEVNIPDKLSKIEISSLNLYGKISADGIERLKKLFPKSRLNINNVWDEK
ncbi:MAG: DUF4419 domain-containing protein [Pedobacter sp.]|nr:MAG: DUF4419 domain-containing protein [Pedobacter sp.]